VRQVRPEIPPEVSDVVCRLMDPDPDQRFPSARTTAAALTGFGLWLPVTPPPSTGPEHRSRVLLIEDEPSIRKLMASLLRDRYDVREAPDAETALTDIARNPPDLLAVDVNLPGLSGQELVNRLRASGLGPDRLSVLLMSGNMPEEALGGLSLSGADDYLAKPFKPAEFVSRVRALLLRRAAQSSGERGTSGVMGIKSRVVPVAANRAGSPSTPPPRAAAAAEALSLTVSRLLIETGIASEGHWNRLTKYVRALAAAVPDRGEYSRLKDEEFIELLAAVMPVHDVGLLVVPRGVLMKPDKLTPDEQSVVQTHSTVGSEVLQAVAGKLVAELPSLPLAAEVSRGHHERWDGTGYPDQLGGPEIPLPARVAAIVTVYEALRGRRPHRPPLGHSRAVKIITLESPGQFDPVLVAAFSSVAAKFEQIHQTG
jgi:response regulator RpfG family c-di-GMP phosphodiesterase